MPLSYVTYPNLTNLSNLSQVFVYNNTVTNGFFVLVFLETFHAILYMIMLRKGSDVALFSSTTVTTLVAFVLVGADMLPMYWAGVLTCILMISLWAMPRYKY